MRAKVQDQKLRDISSDADRPSLIGIEPEQISFVARLIAKRASGSERK